MRIILRTFEALNTLLLRILEDGKQKGQCTLKGLDGNIFCTWNIETDSNFVFISCIPHKTVVRQVSILRIWLIVFYCAVLMVSICSVFLLSWQFNKNYTSLQELYQKAIIQYRDNHNYIKDLLLRNFLTSKSDFPALEERFSENEIDLENYKYYSLVLVEVIAQPHFVLQAILSQVISDKFRFEVIDVLQNRLLLILECNEASILTNVLKKLASECTGGYGHLLPGLYVTGILSLEDIPEEYQRLSHEFDMLYFYPESCGFLDAVSLGQRKRAGLDRIEPLCSRLLAELKKQNFSQATTLLDSFFDEWYEPLSDAHCTVEKLIKTFSTYINTFMDAYAVTMDFDIITFQNNITRCKHASDVKAQFLSLIKDICSVFSGISQRSNYINVILNVIQNDYHDPNLSPDTLADKVALSAPYLNSVFKSVTGISISGYIRHFRLQKAAELLTETNLSIGEIATQTGFSNASYFYTVFKKYHSITPNEYRLQHTTLKTEN